MFSIRVVTAAGENASSIGESYSRDGVTWRNAVDGCDSDGCGRVFIDCESEEIASDVTYDMDGDDRIQSYEASVK